MTDTIEITVKTFRGPANSDEYRAIYKALTERGLKHFEVWHTPDRGRPGVHDGVYHVEPTPHLFGDQSNTMEGLRIFDWYDGMSDNRAYRIMHWIEPGPGWDLLQAWRRSTYQCGYCGKQYPSKEPGVVDQWLADRHNWCTNCRGSEYLKPAEYRLLQLLPVCQSFGGKRDAAIPQDVMDDIAVKQAERAKALTAKWFKTKMEKLQESIDDAKLELDFFYACIEAGLVQSDLENMIYYSHTGKFTFGWRTRISDDGKARLKDLVQPLRSRFDIEIVDPRS